MNQRGLEGGGHVKPETPENASKELNLAEQDREERKPWHKPEVAELSVRGTRGGTYTFFIETTEYFNDDLFPS